MTGHPGAYMGWWGNMGSPKQKGITTYTVSPFAQSPLKGSLEKAFFNTFRRTKAQAFYILAPGLLVWELWAWGRDKNEFVYTKAGRELLHEVSA